jgi:excisionase family DNA binding protein
LEKLALSIPEAVERSSLGRSLIYKSIADGSLPSLRAGSRRLILTADLERWLLTLRDTALTAAGR